MANMTICRAGRYAFFLLFFLFMPVFCSHGAEHIVLYRLGAQDPVVWEKLRKSMTAKGYRVSIFDGASTIEGHVEIANKINALRASVLLAMDLAVGSNNRFMAVVTVAKRGKGSILAIDELPALHINDSRELATALASQFDKGVKELPLFPLLGVDMPGVFVKVTYTPDKETEVFAKLHAGLRRYFERGLKDER